jgi:hypothetical protein
VRAESGVDHGRRIHLFVRTGSPEAAALIDHHRDAIRLLARCQAVENVEVFPPEGTTTPVSVDSIQFAIQHERSVADLESQIVRLRRRRIGSGSGIASLRRAFLARAPARSSEERDPGRAGQRLDDLDRRLSDLAVGRGRAVSRSASDERRRPRRPSIPGESGKSSLRLPGGRRRGDVTTDALIGPRPAPGIVARESLVVCGAGSRGISDPGS